MRDPDRARRELTELAQHATYRDGIQHLERWRSPKRTGGGLRWLIDSRTQSVVWVGFAAPPIERYLVAEPKPGRGGARIPGPGKRLGRPPKPVDDAYRNDVRIRLTDDQMQRLIALSAAGHTARDVLLAGVEALSGG